jgi:hypothetical protein
MRVWGRANGSWVEVSTDANGSNQAVYVTWLAQVLKLNLGESPFWANWGIPQYQTIMTQIAPDFYMQQTQSFFSGKFAALAITRIPNTVNPTYNVNVVLNNGATINLEVPT